MTDFYGPLAFCYDRLMAEVDYDAWVDFYEKCFAKYAVSPVKAVTDIGCGTGNLTLPLARRGYAMTGLDISEEMLSLAAHKAETEAARVLFLSQNMTAFDTGAPADAVICGFDGVNYLLSSDEVYACFGSVYENLKENGLFVFDLSTPYKYENVLGNQVYTYEYDDLFVCWQNCYHEKSGFCDFLLTFFRKDKNGLWHRSDEVQRQRRYAERTIRALLDKAGFELLETCEDIAFTPVSKTGEREFFIARKKG